MSYLKWKEAVKEVNDRGENFRVAVAMNDKREIIAAAENFHNALHSAESVPVLENGFTGQDGSTHTCEDFGAMPTCHKLVHLLANPSDRGRLGFQWLATDTDNTPEALWQVADAALPYAAQALQKCMEANWAEMESLYEEDNFKTFRGYVFEGMRAHKQEWGDLLEYPGGTVWQSADFWWELKAPEDYANGNEAMEPVKVKAGGVDYLKACGQFVSVAKEAPPFLERFKLEHGGGP